MFCAVSLAAPAHAAAATLSFSPTSASQAVGDEFSIRVLIDPAGQSVNAADGTVSYDTSLLTLESFSKDSSVFSLWTAEPTISKSSGTLQFSGGTPTAFSTGGTVLTLTFKALKSGSATLSFTKGSILAADGKGTDVYTAAADGSVTITDAAPADTSGASDTADYAPVADAGPPPIAPIISSLSFPDESSWYATSTGAFNWNLPLDATGVRTLLSTSASDTPSAVLKPMASSTIVSGIKDGISYFYVQVQNGSGWGDIAKRTVQIDTEPPSGFSVALQAATNGSVPKLAFKADDTLSGIDHYEILIGSSSVATIASSDAADGTYPVPPQAGGSQLVTIKAYDKAGNMTAASSTLDLPKVADKSAQADATTATQPTSAWNIDRILTILFAFIIGGLVTWIRFNKKAAEQDRSRLIRRLAEASDKNDRVFSAMREEFEQMISDFDKRPYLTPEERAFLEDVKEVLDISEELIDTGMEELKKLVRTGEGE